jgi:hypothetical protein
MRNPAPATHTVIGGAELRPAALGLPDPDARFAPLCTRPAELAITTVSDELGRPLVGVFVPDDELL